MTKAITSHTPAALAVISCDDFLPPPGRWTRRIGTQVLMALGVVVGASSILPFEQTVRSEGVVRPSGENSVVQSQLSGKVQQVLLRPNQEVQADQVLAVLDQGALLSKRQQIRRELGQVEEQIRQSQRQLAEIKTELQSSEWLSQAQIASSRGEVAKAKAALALATDQMQRYRDLARSGAAPLLLSQEKETRHQLAISEMEQAELGVQQQRARQQGELARLRQTASGLDGSLAGLHRQAAALQAELRDSNRALANSTIRAPMAGSVITTALKHPGQVINSGDVIAQIAPSQAPVVVKTLVKPQEVSRIKPGQKVYLRISGCPYSEFGLLKGTVQGIGADVVSGDGSNKPQPANYEVRIHPSSNQLRQGQKHCALRFGMDLKADVMTGRTTMLGFLLRKIRLAAEI